MKLRKLSFDLFVGLWNTRQNLETPPIHLDMTRWLAQQSRSVSGRLLLMAFRGCGKSTLTGLFCAWHLCQNPELRILIISADEALAENMLRHVRHILETHPVAAPLIPAKKQLWSSDRLLIERSTISRDPSLRAAGLHSTITGARADLIICDDVEVPNTCDTQTKRLTDVRLDPSWITSYEDEKTFTSVSCYWDPAFGRENGDQSVVAYVGMTQDHTIYIDAILVLPKSTDTEDAATMQCRLVTDFLIRHHITHIILETNGLGQFLPGLLRKHLKERQHICRVEEHHASHNKTHRILHAFEARLAARAIFMHTRVIHSGLTTQMRDWQPDNTQNSDDILDAVSGAIQRLIPRHVNAKTYFLRTDDSHDS